MPYGYRVCYTERSKHRVVAWNPDTNDIEVLAGTEGNAESEQKLNDPYGLIVNNQGILFVADKLNDRICRIQRGKLKPVECFKGYLSGSKSKRKPIKILNPAGLFFELDSNSVLAAFSGENVICRIQENGEVGVVLGIPPGTRYDIVGCDLHVPPERVASTPLHVPVAVAKRTDGTIFFIERGHQSVREYHPKHGIKNLFTARYTSNIDRRAIPDEVEISTFRPIHPTALAIDKQGELYLADGVCGCVWLVDFQAGTLRRVMQSLGQSGPVALAFGKDGTLWVHDGAIGFVRGFKCSKGRWQEAEGRAQTIKEGLPCVSLGGAGIVCV